MSDPQDVAEALDDDKVGAEFPPEEPLGVDDYGVTEAEQRWDEPLEERVDREEPDPLVEALEGRDARDRARPGPEDRVEVQPFVHEGDAVLDDEKDAVAEAVVGGTGDDPTGEVTDRTATGSERAPAAAEEAAMHIEDPQ
jgi:hypothetical protein